MSDDLLKIITDLSHQFGGVNYVKAGGGNTSVKNEEFLWVKPSGTTLEGISAGDFVQLQRQGIEKLYTHTTPADPKEREELVKKVMSEAVIGINGKRPSVEAPLHNVFEARYVVHTHPVVVNGLTCAKEGKSHCARLFPQALWVDYIDPGYTLCMQVRDAIGEYKQSHGHEPELLFMKNHGIFVSADTPQRIIELYTMVFEILEQEYASQGISLELQKRGEASEALSAKEKEIIIENCPEAKIITASAAFDLPDKALSPDHIVYMKSCPYKGPVDAKELQNFISTKGYEPRIIITEKGVYALGTDRAGSERALLLAEDEAHICQLTHAFGGIEVLEDAAIDFIDNWEVEQYRRKVAETGV